MMAWTVCGNYTIFNAFNFRSISCLQYISSDGGLQTNRKVTTNSSWITPHICFTIIYIRLEVVIKPNECYGYNNLSGYYYNVSHHLRSPVLLYFECNGHHRLLITISKAQHDSFIYSEFCANSFYRHWMCAVSNLVNQWGYISSPHCVLRGDQVYPSSKQL